MLCCCLELQLWSSATRTCCVVAHDNVLAKYIAMRVTLTPCHISMVTNCRIFHTIDQRIPSLGVGQCILRHWPIRIRLTCHHAIEQLNARHSPNDSHHSNVPIKMYLSSHELLVPAEDFQVEDFALISAGSFGGGDIKTQVPNSGCEETRSNKISTIIVWACACA